MLCYVESTLYCEFTLQDLICSVNMERLYSVGHKGMDHRKDTSCLHFMGVFVLEARAVMGSIYHDLRDQFDDPSYHEPTLHYGARSRFSL